MYAAAFIHTSLDNRFVFFSENKEQVRTSMRKLLQQFGMSGRSVKELTGKAFDAAPHDSLIAVAATRTSSTSFNLIDAELAELIAGLASKPQDEATQSLIPYLDMLEEQAKKVL